MRDSSPSRFQPVAGSSEANSGDGSRACRYALSVARTPGRLRLPRNVARLERGDERRNEPLAPPSAAAQERIAVHLGEEHRIEPFQLERHVYLDGPRLESQLISWDPGKASFQCLRCPGYVFGTEEITEEMIDFTLLWDDGVKPFLAGARTDEERREIARAYRAGELTAEVLRPWRRKQRRKPAAPRPSVEHRRQRVQAWMLGRYGERGVLARVLEDAIQLWREQPCEWARISDLAPVESTLRRYWQQIPDDQVAAAKAAYQARRAIDARS